MLMNISMFYNVHISIKGANHYVCSEKMKWYIDLRKLENLHFFGIILEGKTSHFLMDYVPLYGDRKTSKYISIQLNLANNYCLTIYNYQWKNKEYNLDTWWLDFGVWISFAPHLWRKLLFVGIAGNFQSEAPTQFLIFVSWWKCWYKFPYSVGSS